MTNQNLGLTCDILTTSDEVSYHTRSVSADSEFGVPARLHETQAPAAITSDVDSRYRSYVNGVRGGHVEMGTQVPKQLGPQHGYMAGVRRGANQEFKNDTAPESIDSSFGYTAGVRSSSAEKETQR